MVLLQNVLINTSRSARNGSTGVTAAPTAYLSSIGAHAQPVGTAAYIKYGTAILGSEYEVSVDTGVDIATGDIITSITQLDGVTPWPGNLSPGANVTWRVKHATEAAALLLPHRSVFIERTVKGGKAHP